MADTDQTRRWVIGGVALAFLNLIGPDGSWKSVFWRSSTRSIEAPPLHMGGEISGKLTLRPLPLRVAVALGSPRINPVTVGEILDGARFKTPDAVGRMDQGALPIP